MNLEPNVEQEKLDNESYIPVNFIYIKFKNMHNYIRSQDNAAFGDGIVTKRA